MTFQREAGFEDLNELNKQGINLNVTNVKDMADLIFWRALIINVNFGNNYIYWNLPLQKVIRVKQ